MTTRVRATWTRLAAVTVAASLLLVSLPAAALAVADPDTLVAPLDGNNMPSDGDPGGSGTFSIALDGTTEQACFVLDVTLSDLAGDPPTSIDIHDSMTGDPGDVVLPLATSVDGAGNATACVAASASLINAMFAAPANYYVAVHTAAYPDGAIRGFLWYSYPTGTLSVATLVCPPGIQSATDLTPDAKESCLSVVLPADDVSGSFPPGYTISGYGGTAAFDYHVTDGKHLDATIANATRGGGGTCNSTSMTCSYGALPYEWTAGMGELHVIPTLLPAGTRFGAAEAKDALEPGGPVPLTVGAGNELTVDASSVEGVYVLLYLFQAPDTTAPSVSTPIVKLRSGTTFGTTGPIRLVWTGSDAGSGIDHYVVQRSVDGGGWTTLSSVSGTAYNTSIARGHAYRFRVRAVDKAGNKRTSAATASQHFRVVQDTSPSVGYTGTWHTQSRTSASGGRLHYSPAAGSTASLTFTGRAIAWVAPMSLTRGSARIYVDGTYVTTISLHGAAESRQVVYAKRFAALGTHTIKIKVVGTAGHPRVDVDAFLFLN